MVNILFLKLISLHIPVLSVAFTNERIIEEVNIGEQFSIVWLMMNQLIVGKTENQASFLFKVTPSSFPAALNHPGLFTIKCTFHSYSISSAAPSSLCLLATMKSKTTGRRINAVPRQNLSICTRSPLKQRALSLLFNHYHNQNLEL